MLVNGIKELKEATVVSHSLPNALAPGEKFEIVFNEDRYLLCADGKGKAVGENWDSISDYNLCLFDVLPAGNKTTELVRKEYFEDAIISLIWCGDIDKDQKPDFLINTTHHYNVGAMTLYLSSEAEDGKLVKEVAKFVTTGC
jgi:hypothetical protein